MLTQLLSNLVAGGITGYITNTMAIKMLFKKYPIVGGGVLASNFEEFVENISKLVERDLINHATLEHEFSSDTFKSELQKAVEHLLKQALYKRFPDTTLGDIEGLKESLDAMLDFLEPMEADLIDALLERSAAHINIDALLPKELQQELSQALFSHLYETIVTLTPEVMEQLRNSDISIERLLTKRMMDLLDGGLETLLEMLLQSIDPLAFETMLYDIRDSLGLDTLIPALLEMLFSKSIQERLGEKRTTALSQHLMGRFLLLMESSQGREELIRLSAAILESLKGVDEPLSDLLSEQTTSEIVKLVETHLPRLLTLMIEWLEANSGDLEVFIERLIDDSLKSGGPLGKMKYSFKAVFLGKVTERFRLIERLTGILDDESSREAHVRKGLDLVLDAISRRSIGQVLTELTERNWLTPLLVARLIQLNLPRAAPFIERLMFGELFARPLSSLFNSGWQGQLLDQVESLLEPQRLSLWLKDTQKNRELKKLAASQIRKTVQRPLGSLINEKSPVTLLEMLSKHEPQMQLLFTERVQKRVQDLPLSTFLDKETLAFIRPKIQHLLQEQKSAFTLKAKSTRLHTLFDIVAGHESSAERLSDIAVMGINDNLPLLLEKNVSTTVKNELLSMGPTKLQEQVEEFMGAELGPITWLGAGLGAGVGGVLYGVQQLSGALSGPYLYATIPLVYGATGVLTNWLALKMLFRPYERKSLLGMNIPFTPGIVGKRKPFFAKNMSKFVDETLLTQDAIHDKIITLRPHLIETLKAYIVADDYRVAGAFLDQHAEYFSTEIFFSAYGMSTKQFDTEAMAKRALFTANSTDLSYFRDPSNRKALRERGRRRIESGLIARAQQWLDDHATQTFEHALPTEVAEVTDRLISLGVDRALTYIHQRLEEKEPLLEMIATVAEPVLKQWQDRPIHSLLTPKMQALFTTRLSEYVVSRLQSDRVQHEVIDFLQSMLIEETVQTDKNIGEMFNGALTETIEENLRLLFDHGLDGIIEQLQGEKRSIISEIRRAVKSHNSFATNALFRASGVFGDIRRFITILIDKEMPIFLNERKAEIESVTHQFLEELKEKELSTFGIKDELLDLHTFAPIVNEVLSHHDVASGIAKVSMMMVEDTYTATLGEQLEVMEFHSVSTMLEMLEEEIDFARVQLRDSLQKEHTLLTQQLSSFIQNTRSEFFSHNTLNDLLAGLTHQDVEEQIRFSSQQLFSSPGYARFEQHLVTALLDGFDTEGIASLVDESRLQKSLEQTITTLLGDDAFRDSIARVIIPFMATTLRSLNTLVDKRLKEYLLDNGLEAIYDTVVANMDGLVGSIDFKEVIEREINAMHPSELEEMLNSFAKVYFNRLILYGAYGAVFGIPVAFSY